MTDKMAQFYRPWYVWLMRIAHFRWARVVVAVVGLVISCLIVGVVDAWRESAPPAIRDAREGDWS